jgi:hypothetical protein
VDKQLGVVGDDAVASSDLLRELGRAGNAVLQYLQDLNPDRMRERSCRKRIDPENLFDPGSPDQP